MEHHKEMHVKIIGQTRNQDRFTRTGLCIRLTDMGCKRGAVIAGAVVKQQHGSRTDRHKDGQAGKQTGRHVERQTDLGKCRQTNRHIQAER
jgi:hypothetical protein